MTAVWFKLTSAAEIMYTPCYQIISKTASCIKVSSEWLAVCVYGNENSFAVTVTL